MRCIQTAFLSILFAFSSIAQEEIINFDIWEADYTGVGSLVLDFHQDNNGYIWLSTFNGVIRFDGTLFTPIVELYPASEAFTSKHISCVRTDNSGNIWVGTIEAGLFLITEKGTVKHINDLVVPSDSLQEYRITDIEFYDDIVLIHGRTGLTTYQRRDNQMAQVKDIAGIPDAKVTGILTHNDDILLTTRDQVITLTDRKIIGSDFSKPYLFTDKKNVLWLANYKNDGSTLYRFENGKWILHDDQPYRNIKGKRRFSWDYQNRLWAVKARENIMCYDMSGAEWIIKNQEKNSNLHQLNVRAILVDNSGTVWLGAEYVALLKKRGDIKSYQLNDFSKFKIRSFIWEDDTFVFTDNSSGIYYKKKGKVLRHFTSKNSGLASDRYIRIEKLSNGKYGITNSKGFQIMDERGQFSKVIKARGSNRSICEVGDYYYVGGVSKLIKIDKKTLVTTIYPFRSYNIAQNIYINGLAVKSPTELYVGSNFLDIHIFDTETGKFNKIIAPNEDAFRSNNSNHLDISDQGVLAIANEGGLFTYDGTSYEKLIPRAYLKSVKWLNDSLLMAASQNKIYKVNTYTKKVSLITGDDGLLNSQFSLRSVIKTENQICFGGNNGLDCISPDTPNDTLSTILTIENVVIDNDIEIDLPDDGSEIILPKHTQQITVKLSQVFTQKQHTALIEYRNNDQQIWHPLTNNTLSLDNPRSGKHEFLFRSQIPDYHGKNKTIRLSFQIPTPWYEHFISWIIAISLLAMGSVWLITKSQNQKKEKQIKDAQLKADIAELRLQIMSGQMNPHFTFNALNSVLQMINEQDTESASVYIQKFSKMLRFVLEYSDQSWVDLQQELEFLENYLQLEQMRFNDSFDYKIDVTGLPSGGMIPPFFIQPKIENAIKHGIRGLDKRGEIIVKIHLKNNTIDVSVQDNGIGRIASEHQNQYYSNNTKKGILLTRKRIKQLKKMGYHAQLTITDINTDGKCDGTRVDMTLPIKTSKQNL